MTPTRRPRSSARSTRRSERQSKPRAGSAEWRVTGGSFPLTARTELEPSAVSLLTISRDGPFTRDRRTVMELDGTLSARYWSEASKEQLDPAGIFYFWKGERPRHPNAPELEGTGEIKLESVDRANGYFTYGPTEPRPSIPRRQVSTCGQSPQTRRCLTAVTPTPVSRSSRGVSPSGGI